MATFREIMEAAARADAAGDTEAASQLVNFARAYRAKATPAASQLVTPQAYDDTGERPQPEQDRFGDTLAAATAEPRAALSHYAGEVMNSENAPIDRLKAAGMTALSAAGTTYAAGAGLAGELLGGSPTNERKLARDLMMMGEVAAPELAGVSSTTRLIGKAGREAAKLDKPVTAMQETARAADDLGVTPALGATSKTGAQAAAGLEKVPFAGSIIAKDAQRYVGDIEKAYGEAVARVGKAGTPEGAGMALQSGADKFVTTFKRKSDELYADVGKHIPKGTVIQAPETLRMIREAAAPFESLPAVSKRAGISEWLPIADDLENGLTWQAATALRSSIGKSIGKIKGPMADMDEGMLKNAYAQLTADLEAAAKAAGPAAERSFKRASDYYRAGNLRVERALDKTIDATNPERAFEAFANFAKKDRASSDIQRMKAIKKSIPAQDWETVSASIVQRLGQKGDDFSPAKFLTEWKKLSPDAKSMLLTPGARREFEKIASLAEGAGRINAERNFSNTGGVNAILATVVGSGVAPMTTVGTLAAANLSARAMTSERFLQGMNRMARGDDRLMKAIAKSEHPLAQDAITILRMSSADAAAGTPAANFNEPAAQMAR